MSEPWSTRSRWINVATGLHGLQPTFGPKANIELTSGLHTNARLTPLQAVLRHRDLVRVEDLFRRAKAVLRTRPILHSCDAAIRGHVFCSFLALLLQKRCDDLMLTAGVTLE